MKAATGPTHGMKCGKGSWKSLVSRLGVSQGIQTAGVWREGRGRGKAALRLLCASLKGGGCPDYSPETKSGETIVRVQSSQGS